MVTFQILVPTIPARAAMLQRLMLALNHQIQNHPGASVHVVHDLPDRKETIGEKRARAVAESTADYVAFVDDDDLVSRRYLDVIMPLLDRRPDCCGITVAYYQDGKFQSEFEHSLRHRDNPGWSGRRRTPHHLCPIRRDIATEIPFPAQNWGEDYAFAMAILPSLQVEEWCGDQPIYNYMWVSGKVVA
jgi:hypothetical protein